MCFFILGLLTKVEEELIRQIAIIFPARVFFAFMIFSVEVFQFLEATSKNTRKAFLNFHG